MPLNAKILAEINGLFTKTKGQGIGSYEPFLRVLLDLTHGTGADQIDLAYATAAAGKILAASTNDDHDLNGATLDPLGDALPLVKLKAFFLFNRKENTQKLVVGNAGGTVAPVLWFGANTQTEDVHQGGFVARAHPGAGWTITPGTGDILRVANGAGASVKYDMLILGCSA